MKKLLTIALILCTLTASAQMRGGSQFDPGAVRSDLTNITSGSALGVANGGTGKTTAAAGLAALGGASLNGSSTVDFAAKSTVFPSASGPRQANNAGYLTVAGGQFATSGNGAFINLVGNEYSTAFYQGAVQIFAGQPAGFIQMNTAGGNCFVASSGALLIGTDLDADDDVTKLQVAGGMRLISGAAPANPIEGTMYFNSTDKHFYGYNGTAWVQLDN